MGEEVVGQVDIEDGEAMMVDTITSHLMYLILMGGLFDDRSNNNL